MLDFWRNVPLMASVTRPPTEGGMVTACLRGMSFLKAKAREVKVNPAEESERAHAMLDFIGDAVLSTDTDARITYMNAPAEALTGFSRREAVGQPLEDIFRAVDVKTRKTRNNLARQVMDSDTSVSLHNSALLITRDGSELAIEDAASPLHNENGEVIGALLKFHDSRYSDETTARMAYLAQHDALTGLLNRHAFAERFDQSAALAQRHNKKMVLLFIDLDNFKEVNDTLGHASGDTILKNLARELRACVRTTDHVCRLGGDEFVVLLSDLNQHEQAFAVVEKVREAAAGLSRSGEPDTPVNLSIGISTYPDNGTTLKTLLSHADAAMYQAKASHQETNPQNWS